MNARFAAAMARALAEETQTEPPAQGTRSTRAWAHSGMKEWAA
jgi:hypothetical protein